MNKIFERLDRIRPFYDWVNRVTMTLCKLLLIADILVASYQVLSRFVGFLPDYAWTEEVVLTCMVYTAMLSATMALRSNRHIRMTALDRYLPDKLVKVLDLVADLAVLAFGIIMLKEGLSFALNTKALYTSMPFLSKSVLFASVPLAGLITILVEIESIYIHIKALIYKEEGCTV